MSKFLNKELLEELNTLLIKLGSVPDMKHLQGLNCFSGDIDEYEEYTSNKFANLKPFLIDEKEINYELINLSLLKAAIQGVVKKDNELFGNLETSSFLSYGDY